MNVNIVKGKPEQVIMHNVMHAIVLYMTQSVLHTVIVHLECLMLIFV